MSASEFQHFRACLTEPRCQQQPDAIFDGGQVKGARHLLEAGPFIPDPGGKCRPALTTLLNMLPKSRTSSGGPRVCTTRSHLAAHPQAIRWGYCRRPFSPGPTIRLPERRCEWRTAITRTQDRRPHESSIPAGGARFALNANRASRPQTQHAAIAASPRPDCEFAGIGALSGEAEFGVPVQECARIESERYRQCASVRSQRVLPPRLPPPSPPIALLNHRDHRPAPCQGDHHRPCRPAPRRQPSQDRPR